MDNNNNTIHAGSLEEFVSLLCSKPPQAPCTQMMEIENANDPNELRDICTQIFAQMFPLLKGDFQLAEKYFLSLGFRIFQTTNDDIVLKKSTVIQSRVRMPGKKVLAFECLGSFTAAE